MMAFRPCTASRPLAAKKKPQGSLRAALVFGIAIYLIVVVREVEYRHEPLLLALSVPCAYFLLHRYARSLGSEVRPLHLGLMVARTPVTLLFDQATHAGCLDTNHTNTALFTVFRR